MHRGSSQITTGLTIILNQGLFGKPSRLQGTFQANSPQRMSHSSRHAKWLQTMRASQYPGPSPSQTCDTMHPRPPVAGDSGQEPTLAAGSSQNLQMRGTLTARTTNRMQHSSAPGTLQQQNKLRKAKRHGPITRLKALIHRQSFLDRLWPPGIRCTSACYREIHGVFAHGSRYCQSSIPSQCSGAEFSREIFFVYITSTMLQTT